MGCKGCVKRSLEIIGESIDQVRETFVRNTVGRLGPVFCLLLTVFGIAWHILILSVGAIHKGECPEVQILPVYMALLGITGTLKFLGLVLQLVIAMEITNNIEPEKKPIVMHQTMSEPSNFDDFMNGFYVAILIIGIGAVLPSFGNYGTCNQLMFDTAFYSTVILLAFLGIICIWIIVEIIVDASWSCSSQPETLEGRSSVISA